MLQHVNKTLHVIPRPQPKKYLLTKLFGDPKLVDLVPKSKSILAQQKNINGFMNTLKNPSFKKLAIKHVLLVATVNNVDISLSMKQNVHVLGVHHCNMMYAIKHSKLIDDNNLF